MTLQGVLAFVHVVGVVLWLGGGFAAMVAAIAARRESPAARAGVFRALGLVHAWLVGPGALLTVASGLALVMVFVSADQGERLGLPAISVMMGAGLVAGLLALFVGLPTSQKLAALAVADDEGRFPPAFERLRTRLAIVSSVAGMLALVALYFGVVGA